MNQILFVSISYVHLTHLKIDCGRRLVKIVLKNIYIYIYILLELKRSNEELIEDICHNERMIFTKEDSKLFNSSKCCHICKKEFGSSDKIVRDRHHRTGKFRGAAHSKCNINYYTNRYLPVVCHNLRGYDSHFIIRKAYEINEQLGNKNINVIPNSYEDFMTFSIGDLKFVDSFQFMASSLEKLVEHLYDEEDKFKHCHSIKKILMITNYYVKQDFTHMNGLTISTNYIMMDYLQWKHLIIN